MLSKEKGITLIALIITIIVMILLVGVTISVTLNGGLFNKAKKASYQTNVTSINEQLVIAKATKLAANNGKAMSDYGITIEHLQISDELKEKYGEKLVISKDANLYYDSSKVTGEEVDWLKEIGITEYTGINDDGNGDGNGDGNDDGNGDGNDQVYHEGIIPTGGVYKSVDGTVYNPGDNFPETVQEGDIYTFGDYEYRYNYSFNYSWMKNSTVSSVTGVQLSDGWGVRVLDTTKSEYEEIINSINNAQIVSMSSTFVDCSLMEKTPTIPESVEMMSSTFRNCVLMEKAPVIPSNVTNISYAFSDNKKLTGEVEINCNPTIVTDCFYGTEKDITITGSASETTKAALKATATNNNVEIK